LRVVMPVTVRTTSMSSSRGWTRLLYPLGLRSCFTLASHVGWWQIRDFDIPNRMQNSALSQRDFQ
jgi:hypothetical protein